MKKRSRLFLAGSCCCSWPPPPYCAAETPSTRPAGVAVTLRFDTEDVHACSTLLAVDAREGDPPPNNYSDQSTIQQPLALLFDRAPTVQLDVRPPLS